jgi:hypothetical protein
MKKVFVRQENLTIRHFMNVYRQNIVNDNSLFFKKREMSLAC